MLDPQTLGWLIGGIQCVGLRVVGDYRKLGWLIACVADLVSITFGLTTGLWGFFFWPIINCGTRIRHLYKYRHETWGRFQLTQANMKNATRRGGKRK